MLFLQAICANRLAPPRLDWGGIISYTTQPYGQSCLQRWPTDPHEPSLAQQISSFTNHNGFICPQTWRINFSNISFSFQHRSFSKCNMNCVGESVHTQHRPRQNSVFVGSSTTVVALPMNPPRKTKSAMDIQTMVLAESSPGHCDSVLPMTAICAADSRRPSCSRLESIHVSNVWNTCRKCHCYKVLTAVFVTCSTKYWNYLLELSIDRHVEFSVFNFPRLEGKTLC